MKNIYIAISLNLLLITSIDAQSIQKEVYGSAGKTDSIAAYNVAWTIGEIITEGFTTENFIVTQGFHQPQYVITGIPVLPEVDYSVKAFPNPARDYLNIEICKKIPEKFLLTFRTMDGKTLSEAEFISGETYRVNLTQFRTNLIYLIITNDISKQSRILKIIKTN